MAEGKVYRWPGAVPRIPTEQQLWEGQTPGERRPNKKDTNPGGSSVPATRTSTPPALEGGH